MTLQIRLQKVELKRPEFDLRRGLAKSPTLNWLPVSVNSADLVEPLRENASVDGREVVEWMHIAAADNAVFEAFGEEYRVCSVTGGGTVLSVSDDAYIPGVRVGNLRGESVRGSTVRSRGYGNVITPYGSFRVPVGGKALYAYKDLLAWAALPWCESVQWCLTLLQWTNLAKAPISKRVRFPSSHGKVAPNFFLISTRIPSPICFMKIGLTSNKAQTIQIRGRGTKGNYHTILFEDSFKIDKGESETIYYVTGFPVVGQFTLELQPEDHTKTVLDYLEVYP